MTSTSPVLIAGAVIVACAVTSLLANVIRTYHTFRGYREVAADAKQLSEQLDCEVFRDNQDLVVTGEYKTVPILLRFSNSDNTPALQLEARIPSDIDLSLNPKQLVDNKFGTQVRTNAWLEQRFVCRSKSPLEADLLLAQRGIMNILVRLCRSQKTLLEVGTGKLQLFEMVAPASLSQHIMEHLVDIGDLARIMQTLPGSDRIKVKPIPREKSSWAFRVAMSTGVLIAAVSVMAAMRDRTPPVLTAVKSAEGNGILESDASLIPMADEWRVAESGDFDPAFTGYFISAGQKPDGRTIFDPDGTGHNKGVAYFLTNKGGTKRLVILVGQHSIFDSSFPNIAGVARVPSPYFSNDTWDETKTVRQQISGDAILLVRNADDVRSGIVLYFRNGGLQSTALSDYRRIRVE